MQAIRSGHLTAFFLFDVAEAIDLPRVRDLVGPTVPSRLAPKPATPPYVQYQQPPIAVSADSVGAASMPGFTVRLKVFDYGIVSVALSRSIAGPWDALVAQGPEWLGNPALEQSAEATCRALVGRIAPALDAARADYLSEDYLVFAVHAFDETVTADALIRTRGADIARLLRAEREPLSLQEQEEVFRHRISFYETDVVVPTWSSAFVYDTEEGAQAALEIFEFANSQLLQFRYYDGLLDSELTRIYAQLQSPVPLENWRAGRFTKAARQVQSLFIDVNELTDRTENALKFVGDVYAARLFGLAAARLGLDQWKASVRQKLRTLDDIYKFAVERTALVRGEFLEASIVLILVFELVLIFLGIMD
ncbi:MAG: hypothetical protein HOP14_10900 [Acidobacteria bacterium]|nr:hypothetical protein [Acidobacteriota bacterium]